MKKEALIIVDPWENPPVNDIKEFPNLRRDSQAFAIFLNRVCYLERKRGTQIVFYPTWNAKAGILKELKIKKNDIVTTTNKLPKDLVDTHKLYFCGFHYGECIWRAYNKIKHQDKGIVLNLSMIYPRFQWKNYKEQLVIRYLWCNQGFNEIIVTNIY